MHKTLLHWQHFSFLVFFHSFILTKLCCECQWTALCEFVNFKVEKRSSAVFFVKIVSFKVVDRVSPLHFATNSLICFNFDLKTTCVIFSWF